MQPLSSYLCFSVDQEVGRIHQHDLLLQRSSDHRCCVGVHLILRELERSRQDTGLLFELQPFSGFKLSVVFPNYPYKPFELHNLLTSHLRVRLWLFFNSELLLIYSHWVSGLFLITCNRTVHTLPSSFLFHIIIYHCENYQL